MTTSFGELLSLSVYLKRNFPPFLIRLLDIVHADQKLYLVFEFLDVDLKRYIETGNQNRTPISLQIVKVRLVLLSQEQIFVRVFVTRFKKLTYFFSFLPPNRSSLINWILGFYIATLTASFIGTWNHRIFSLINATIWSWPILALPELSESQWGLILTRSKPFSFAILHIYLSWNNGLGSNSLVPSTGSPPGFASLFHRHWYVVCGLYFRRDGDARSSFVPRWFWNWSDFQDI